MSSRWHFLSGWGEMGELLDYAPWSVAGDDTTVYNASPVAVFAVGTSAGYRLLIESAAPSGLWAAMLIVVNQLILVSMN